MLLEGPFQVGKDKLKSTKKIRPVRLMVRTPDFHSGNRGSIPLRVANFKKTNKK